LHFPRLDADVYLPALLEGIYGSKGFEGLDETSRTRGRVDTFRGPSRPRRAENGKKRDRPRKAGAHEPQQEKDDLRWWLL
jgi:hypothetical protein